MEILILHKCIFPLLKKKILLKAAGRQQQGCSGRLHRHRDGAPGYNGTRCPPAPAPLGSTGLPSLTCLLKADGPQGRLCSEDAPANGERVRVLPSGVIAASTLRGDGPAPPQPPAL